MSEVIQELARMEIIQVEQERRIRTLEIQNAEERASNLEWKKNDWEYKKNVMKKLDDLIVELGPKLKVLDKITIYVNDYEANRNYIRFVFILFACIGVGAIFFTFRGIAQFFPNGILP